MKIFDIKELKIIAIILMIINHFFNSYGMIYKIPDWLDTLQICLTRSAFIIYLFLISEGCIHTRSRTKYFFRLLAFAIISEIPADMCLYNKIIYWGWQNVFFELATVVLLISISDKLKNIYLELPIVIIFSVFAEICHFDYGLMGIILGYLFYKLKDDKNRPAYTAIAFVLLTFINYIIAYQRAYPEMQLNALLPYIIKSSLLECAGIIGFIFRCLYNGKRGNQGSRYIYYIAYPAHMIIIYIIVHYLIPLTA